MKRIFCTFLMLFLTASFLVSCGNSQSKQDKITIVTTVFAEYDWARQILGETVDEVNLVLLTESGTDLHSYQPSIDDMITITTCDLLIYTGGTSDEWITEALSLSPSEERLVVRLTDLLADEELLCAEEHHDGHHDHNEEFDEHVWLSLRHAMIFCNAICEKLSALIPENETVYRENCANYIRQLEELDLAYAEAVRASSATAILFADRFPFAYLFHDYSLACYAAFPGCSSETEASFKTISTLAEAINEFSLPAVVVLESSDLTLAKTIVAATNAKSAVIVTMDSMQSVTCASIESGFTYLSAMTQNLSALKVALGL